MECFLSARKQIIRMGKSKKKIVGKSKSTMNYDLKEFAPTFKFNCSSRILGNFRPEIKTLCLFLLICDQIQKPQTVDSQFWENPKPSTDDKKDSIHYYSWELRSSQAWRWYCCGQALQPRPVFWKPAQSLSPRCYLSSLAKE